MSITLSFPLLAQAFVSGIMLGGVFALIAIGLTLIWGVMGIINFAHGEFLMVGMYIAYFLAARTGLDPYFTILVTVPALFLIGAGIFRVNIQPVLKDPVMNQILLTVGLMLVLQNLALVLFTATRLPPWGSHPLVVSAIHRHGPGYPCRLAKPRGSHADGH